MARAGVLARSRPRERTDSRNEGAVSRMKPHFSWLNLPSCARSAADFLSPVRMAPGLAPRGVRPVAEPGAAFDACVPSLPPRTG